jgi:hypothetical protein
MPLSLNDPNLVEVFLDTYYTFYLDYINQLLFKLTTGKH